MVILVKRDPAAETELMDRTGLKVHQVLPVSMEQMVNLVLPATRVNLVPMVPTVRMATMVHPVLLEIMVTKVQRVKRVLVVFKVHLEQLILVNFIKKSRRSFVKKCTPTDAQPLAKSVPSRLINQLHPRTRQIP